MSSSGFGDGAFAGGGHEFVLVDAGKLLDRRRRHQVVQQRDGVGEEGLGVAVGAEVPPAVFLAQTPRRRVVAEGHRQVEAWPTPPRAVGDAVPR